MHVLAAHLKDARTWLGKDESRLTAEEKMKLEAAQKAIERIEEKMSSYSDQYGDE
jgi:hypothetical protein